MFLISKPCFFLSSSTQNHAESFGNFVKIIFLDPEHEKNYQKSWFGHVRTYCWLNKLRNTQGKIYGTYLGNIHGIYKEYIRNILKYLWDKIIRNTEHRPKGAAAPLGAPPKAAPLCSLFLLIYLLYYESSWMFLIYSSYVPYIYIYIYVS